MTAMTGTIAEIQQGLAAGQFSSVEVTQDYLTRIGLFNDSINCFITITDELALQQAKAADAIIASGNVRPLTGVPLAHKARA